ncbi:MAG: IGHMBP2 family helicase [Euryarchaeota archaeon]|nr:IGHMBP2 family helicase [Euryarchaeota archaeon]
MRRHWEEIRKLPGSKRERLGRAVLALRPRVLGRGLGGVYLVRYSRSDFPDTEIMVGDVVLVSGKKVSKNNPMGTVYEKGRNFITVAFSSPPPAFALKGRVRLDLYASDVTFQRMLAALEALETRKDILPFLLSSRVMLYGAQSVREFDNPRLNDSQKRAVEYALRAERFFLIHGPPGTGKTTTLVEAIVQHVKSGKKVLATADSNVAVDNILEKLIGKVKVVRLGSPARTSEWLREHTLDFMVQSTAEFKEAQKLWARVDTLVKKRDRETRPMPQWRRGLGDDEIHYLASQRRSIRGIPAERIQSMAAWLTLQKEIGDVVERAKKLEMRAVRKIIDDVDVVCATNSTAGSEMLDGVMFDTVFIDEATQSTEPSCLIPMLHGKRFILAGDHKQLPPTVLSRDAEGLKYSLFERLMELHGRGISRMLTVQYRMNERLMEFSNREFYNNAVRTAPEVRNITLSELIGSCEDNGTVAEMCSPSEPLVFVDTHGTMPERQRPGSTSYENPGEAEIVSSLVNAFLEAGLEPGVIGVITPYDDQVQMLREQLPVRGLEIKSVDGFQGREKEVIIISFVRSNTGKIGFLMDPRRLNVSLTRAKRKLVMIGDSSTLSVNALYRRLLNFVREKGRYLEL